MRNRRNTEAEFARRRGLAMVLVMIALTVGTIITLTFLSSQTTSTAIAYNSTRQVQARAIAEDGMRLVIEQVRADTAWRDGQTHGVWTAYSRLNNGGFRVLFEDEDDGDLSGDLSDPFVVTVEGLFDGVVHRVSNRITPRGKVDPTHLLLVVGDAVLSTQDQAKKALFESWGYTVFTIVDTASEADYQTLAENASVAYISEEAYSFDIASRLYNRWLGVVNEEAQMYDELGMANSRGYYTGNTIRISNNTHEITAGLALGNLQIASSSTDLVAVGSNAQSSGATVLATHITATSYPTLAALDIGDTMIDGNPAPNRRVTLPIGGDNFDINLLNANGRQLVRQAVDWAASSSRASNAPLARWSFDEVSGVTANESIAGYDGTYSGGVTLGDPGVIGTSIGLDGDDDVVTIADAPALQVGSNNADFSVSFWVYLGADSTSAYQSVIHKGNANYERTFAIWLLPGSSRLHFRISTTTSSNHGSDSVAALAVDDWTHVAYVKSGQQLRLYLNGVLDRAVDFTGDVVSNDGPIYINDPWYPGFEGRMDDLRIYDFALGDVDVLEVFEEATPSEGTPGIVAEYTFAEPSPVTPQLVSHWKLDGVSDANTFLEDGGEVVIEAESYTAATVGSGSYAAWSWQATTDDTPSGGVAMSPLPNTGVAAHSQATSPRLDYEIKFQTPGTYRVWVRTIGPNGSDNSFHVGLDGVALTTGSGIGMGTTSSTWRWVDFVSGGIPDVEVEIPSAGTYTFNLWMREDGVVVDKLYLKIDPTEPTGEGPAESELVGSAIDELDVSRGTYEFAPTVWLGGHGDGGTSVDFNGSDSFIEVPHQTAYLLDEGSVSFWFRPDGLSGTQGLVAKDASGFGDGGHFRVFADGSSVAAQVQSDAASVSVSSSGGLSAGTWYHVAVGFGAGGLRLYLDGVLVDSESYAGGLGVSSGGTGNQEPWTFGVDQANSNTLSSDNWSDPFDGRIDDVRLYNRNLNAGQAADLFALTTPRAAVPPTVADSSGNGAPLDLTIIDPDHVTWISGGGLTIDAATQIKSIGGVGRLYDAVVESDELTVQIEFTPSKTNQSVPERLIAYGDGTSNRNFELTQDQQQYGVKVRTEFNSSGTPEAMSGNVLSADTREHLIFTYDSTNEELRIYRGGNLVVVEAWSGDLDNWNNTYELILANVEGGSRPWLGTLHRIAIYDGAFNAIQADNVFNGNDPGDGTGGDVGLAYEVEWLESP
ncbi:MAG: LamG-like jellyroll fold domain-containing protein [Planctomycetota bacterium]